MKPGDYVGLYIDDKLIQTKNTSAGLTTLNNKNTRQPGVFEFQ